MFMGEMGSWIVLGLMALRRRWLAKSSPSQEGYRAVDTNDGTEQEPLYNSAEEDSPPARNSLRGLRVFLLSLPAICDICGTTLMNIGLLLVAASIYQMTRGALVLFVGLFSVIFLRRHLKLFQWLALVGVVSGVAVVGIAGAISPDGKASASGGETTEGLSTVAATIIGVLLIAGAQIFTATQFVLEEYLLESSPIEPLTVVGWEGLFGFITTVLIMIVMHLAVGRTDAGRYGYFDMTEGWRQITSNKEIGISSIFIMISIG